MEGDTQKLAQESDTLQQEVETFLNAMQHEDESDRDRYLAYDLQRRAAITVNGQAVSAQTIEIATSHVTVNIALNAGSDTPVELTIDGFEDAIQGRVSEVGRNRSTIQLPLEPKHIESMHRTIRRLSAAVA